MLSIAEKILNAVKTLFGLRRELAQAKLERRARIATLFAQMTECLEATAASIRQSTYPGGRCAELFSYAAALPAAVDEELGPDRRPRSRRC